MKIDGNTAGEYTLKDSSVKSSEDGFNLCTFDE